MSQSRDHDNDARGLDAISLSTGRDGAFGWRVVVVEAAPRLASVLVFGAGLALLSSAAQPTLPERLTDLLEAWPLELVEISHLMASVIGVLLLLIAGGLWRRLDGAYWLTLILLVAGAAFSMIKALDFEEAGLLSVLAIVLAPCRGCFYRQSRLTSALLSGPWIVGVLLALGFSVWLMLSSYAHVEYRDDLWWTMVRDSDISRSFRALAVAGIVGLLILAWIGLHPSSSTQSDAVRAENLERAAIIFSSAQGAHGEANLLYSGDKSFVFSPSGKSFVMFRQRGSHWIAMGDPVGPIDDRDEALGAFHAAADAASASPVIYAASATLLPFLIDHGYTVRKIGEAALVDVDSFTLEGPNRARLRQTRNRLLRDGWQVTVVSPNQPRDWAALKHVSDAWLLAHLGQEKQFSLGRFDADYLARFPIAVVSKADGIPVAFASLWPTPDKGILAIDLMRYGRDAPPSVMDFTFLEVIEWAKSEGYHRLDLGMTPLAGLSRRRYAPMFNKLGAAIYTWGEEIYGFKGLRTYKSKFQPKWEAVFIAAPPHVSLPVALLDAALLTSGGLWNALRT